MSNNFGLSKTEMEIMNMFWEENRGFTFKELLDYFNEEMEKCWKKQTLTTFLTRLIDKGLLNYKKQDKRYYYPSISKDEYKLKCEKELYKEKYFDSFIEYLETWEGDDESHIETIEELREFLNS